MMGIIIAMSKMLRKRKDKIDLFIKTIYNTDNDLEEESSNIY